MTVRDYRLAGTSQIATPVLLVYPDLIRANTEQAIRIAGGTSRLRPHVKTHKSPDILRIQQEAGIERFKCATLAEAQMIAEAGGRDVIVAYLLVGPAAGLLVELVKAYPETTFRPLVESEEGLEAVAAAARKAGLVVEVLLDLDTGMHRTGIRPQQAPPGKLRVPGGKADGEHGTGQTRRRHLRREEDLRSARLPTGPGPNEMQVER